MHVKFPSSQRRVGASTCRPFGAVIWTNSQPSAYALGYFLAPLRGCGQPQAAKRRQSYDIREYADAASRLFLRGVAW